MAADERGDEDLVFGRELRERRQRKGPFDCDPGFDQADALISMGACPTSLVSSCQSRLMTYVRHCSTKINLINA